MCYNRHNKKITEAVMENKDKSLIFSRILVKLCYAVVLACCIFAPMLADHYNEKTVHLHSESVIAPLLVTLYCCVPFAVCVLVCLDILLKNIGNGQPFIAKNVALLRIISYCCFGVALAFIYFAVLRPFAFAIVFAAAFFGVILRVVKNCFKKAVEIREENDATI